MKRRLVERKDTYAVLLHTGATIGTKRRGKKGNRGIETTPPEGVHSKKPTEGKSRTPASRITSSRAGSSRTVSSPASAARLHRAPPDRWGKPMCVSAHPSPEGLRSFFLFMSFSDSFHHHRAMMLPFHVCKRPAGVVAGSGASPH